MPFLAEPDRQQRFAYAGLADDRYCLVSHGPIWACLPD